MIDDGGPDFARGIVVAAGTSCFRFELEGTRQVGAGGSAGHRSEKKVEEDDAGVVVLLSFLLEDWLSLDEGCQVPKNTI